jgi:ribonuclease HI
MALLNKIYTDSSNDETRWYNPTSGEIRRHRIAKERSVHETEYLAIIRVLEDSLEKFSSGDEMEIYCDRETVVKQLNHVAGIKEKQVRKLADRAWSLAYRFKQDKKIETKFLWVSRKNNPTGKMLGV